MAKKAKKMKKGKMPFKMVAGKGKGGPSADGMAEKGGNPFAMMKKGKKG